MIFFSVMNNGYPEKLAIAKVFLKFIQVRCGLSNVNKFEIELYFTSRVLTKKRSN